MSWDSFRFELERFTIKMLFGNSSSFSIHVFRLFLNGLQRPSRGRKAEIEEEGSGNGT